MAASPSVSMRGTTVEDYVANELRSHVLNPYFACLGGRAAVHTGGLRVRLYCQMAGAPDSSELAHDLAEFADSLAEGDFNSFAAAFMAPNFADEAAFESALWRQLQVLHDLDSRSHTWDPAVSSDPDNPHFSFSMGGRAFYVVGLHAASSRWSRRFAWPTLVFNPHVQFERLRERGRYCGIQEAIRERDVSLQGDINPSLDDFGSMPEARQYSGRRHGPGWHCPLEVHNSEDA